MYDMNNATETQMAPEYKAAFEKYQKALAAYKVSQATKDAMAHHEALFPSSELVGRK